jgi:hypothetical protein
MRCYTDACAAHPCARMRWVNDNIWGQAWCKTHGSRLPSFDRRCWLPKVDKSYMDKRCRELEFEAGDQVFLKSHQLRDLCGLERSEGLPSLYLNPPLVTDLDIKIILHHHICQAFKLIPTIFCRLSSTWVQLCNFQLYHYILIIIVLCVF